MRGLFGVAAVVVAAVTLNACKKESASSATAAGLTASTGAAGTYEIPAVQAGKFNAAFVYVGPIGDGGWTYAHNQGRLALERNLPEVHTAYVEKVGEGADGEQVLRVLARKGFDLIVTTSFGYMDATESVAAEYPKVKFLHIAGFKKNATNFGNAFGAMEDMKYLAGMIAGARAQADGNPRLGYIAPFPIPEVIRLLNAVMLGARQTCAQCTMDVRWMNTWFDPSQEQQAAESLFNNGAQVVITGADTSGPIAVAGKRGKWAIGYDSDNACDVDKAHCLTATYWNWGTLYTDVVRQIRSGTWKPSSYYGETDSGLLGLSGFSAGEIPASGVPASSVAVIKQTLAKMQTGQFTRFNIFAGPIKDGAGNTVLPVSRKLTQEDLEGLPGCTTCMRWLAEGIIGQVPNG